MPNDAHKIAQQLISAMEKANISRGIWSFEYRKDSTDDRVSIGAYALYQAWDHGRGGNLYIEAKHEFVEGHNVYGRPKCAACSEGPRDGDHYQEGETNPEPALVELVQALLDTRFFATTLSAAGRFKADIESKRVWLDLDHEVLMSDAASNDVSVEL